MMNVRIHKAVSDLGGVTGMRIVRTIVKGEYDPAVLAQLRTGRAPDRLPGIGAQHALRLLGELGRDMSPWPTVRRFGSFITLAPVDKISGGKLLAAHTHPSTHPAATIFRQAAAAVVKQGRLRAGGVLPPDYEETRERPGRRQCRRHGHRPSGIAVDFYRVLKYGPQYAATERQTFEQRQRERKRKHLLRLANELGCTITEIAA